MSPRKDSGKLLDEETLLSKFPKSRVDKIKRHCMMHGLWEFDQYEDDKVLYQVVLDREFDSSRHASVCAHWVWICRSINFS